jgi:hypothetical protein
VIVNPSLMPRQAENPPTQATFLNPTPHENIR